MKILFFYQMEGTHNYAMNLIVPLMGVAPLLMLFILKGEKKSKALKSWTRSTNQIKKNNTSPSFKPIRNLYKD